MNPFDRRDFLGGVLATGATLAASALQPSEATKNAPSASRQAASIAASAGGASKIDFRYAPEHYQTAFCFPDDPHKSLVDQSGRLLYGYNGEAEIYYFPLMIGFGLHGMKPAKVRSQKLEGPTVPIVTTTLEYPGVSVVLTTFATDVSGEGRVDNVIFEVSTDSDAPANFEPVVEFDCNEEVDLDEKDGVVSVFTRKAHQILLAGRALKKTPLTGTAAGTLTREDDRHQRVTLHRGQVSKSNPYRAFFRFPQANQNASDLVEGLSDPQRLLESCHAFWTAWAPFQKPVSWEVAGRQGEFVRACARNILQAREVRDGKLTFQVGPTCYRGLWVVDGNFILEAARYLGFEKEAHEGLRTTWAGQLPTGQVVALGGNEHWKDTAIAMFTSVRQCELSQDWSLLHELEAEIVHAIQFLRSLQAEAVSQGSALGRYGLLAKGFADGGIDGVRDELTNTVWVLAGLKALAAAAEQQKMASLKDAGALYTELQAAFTKAAPREMRRYETGFDYLPMLLKNDPAWQLPDPWDRPRPQAAQWALSHAIFPGRIFDPQEPIVRGHVQLMEAVTREGIPAETGWNQHESVWNYNAGFVAEVYLWLGMRQAAHDTFIGFLNHASPQYCWREEQPLQNALVRTYVGDMPHNWASAECIRYVRHMLALEDGAHLRLLAGITAGELDSGEAYVLSGTPTRFGALNLKFEPLDRGQGWRLSYERANGPAPEKVTLPAKLGTRFHFAQSEGASSKTEGDVVLLDSAATRWTASWKS